MGRIASRVQSFLPIRRSGKTMGPGEQSGQQYFAGKSDLWKSHSDPLFASKGPACVCVQGRKRICQILAAVQLPQRALRPLRGLDVTRAPRSTPIIDSRRSQRQGRSRCSYPGISAPYFRISIGEANHTEHYWDCSAFGAPTHFIRSQGQCRS